MSRVLSGIVRRPSTLVALLISMHPDGMMMALMPWK